MLIESLVPLFPLCGHSGKSILPPPAAAKPNTSTACPQPGNSPVPLWHTDVLRHSLIMRSLSMVKAPQRAGRVELHMEAKFAAVLQGCQPDCCLSDRRRWRGDTHPNQPEGSCTRQRSVVEDGKGLLSGKSALCAEALYPVPCQLSGHFGTEPVPRGCEWPMVQTAGMAPPRWYFGLLSPEARGRLPLAWCFHSPVWCRYSWLLTTRQVSLHVQPRGFCLLHSGRMV